MSGNKCPGELAFTCRWLRLIGLCGKRCIAHAHVDGWGEESELSSSSMRMYSSSEDYCSSKCPVGTL
jgi:hypothetical protein